MAPAPNMQELIELIRYDAGSGDELDELAAASTTVTEINQTSDAVLGYFVDQARAAGRSWVEISGVLGVTKQAVHKRFAASDFGKQAMTRFTPRARAVAEATSTVAAETHHGFVGTEHLLLALYREPEGIAAKLLERRGLSEESVRAAVHAKVPEGTEAVEGTPPMTPRTRDVIHLAQSEALKLGHGYIGTEHLLLALFRKGDGIAYDVLTELGYDADTAHADLVEALAKFTKPSDQSD